MWKMNSVEQFIGDKGLSFSPTTIHDDLKYIQIHLAEAKG